MSYYVITAIESVIDESVLQRVSILINKTAILVTLLLCSMFMLNAILTCYENDEAS
jgi:hypothetical protein